MSEPKINAEKTNREFFESLRAPDRWGIIKTFLELRNSDISDRMGILPIISAISVAMLAIFTLNPKIIEIDPIVLKILVSALLLLIPSSLYFYLKDIEDGIRKIDKHMESYLGEDINKNDSIKIKWFDKFIGGFPLFVILIYFIIVLILLTFIWKPIFNN